VPQQDTQGGEYWAIVFARAALRMHFGLTEDDAKDEDGKFQIVMNNVKEKFFQDTWSSHMEEIFRTARKRNLIYKEEYIRMLKGGPKRFPKLAGE
jgi:hypothetical protein